MKKKNMIIITLLLSIVAISLGVSVAVFNYFGAGTTNNVIETGRIIFSYSDAELGSDSGNGINITNAMPTPDTDGKLLSSPKEYFDFSVTASTTSTDIAYEISAIKLDKSTMDEDNVKIYLTELVGVNQEKETEITGGDTTPTYKELKTTNNPLLTGKSLYFGTVKAGEVAYGKKFRLRMWIKYPDNEDINYEEINEKMFKVKVNVAAVASN